MIEAVARWSARGVSLLLLGPLASGLAWGGVRASDGSGAATLLTGGSLGAGLIALAITAGCVLAASAIGARLGDRHEGLLNMGFVLAWVAWTGGSMGEVIRLGPGASTLIRVAAEAALLGGLVVVGWLVAEAASRRSVADERLDLSPGAVVGSWRAKAGAGVLASSAVVSLLVAWVFARYGAPGQGLGAAFLAGIASGVVGTQVFDALSEKGDRLEDRLREAGGVGLTAVLAPALAGVMLAGVFGPLIGLGSPGTGRLLDGVARGSLPGWLLIAPAGWGAGALLGTPIGVSMLVASAKGTAGAVERAAVRG